MSSALITASKRLLSCAFHHGIRHKSRHVRHVQRDPLSLVPATSAHLDAIDLANAFENWKHQRGAQLSDPSSLSSFFESGIPIVVKENKKRYEVAAEVPGLTHDEVKVDIRNHILNIMYEKRSFKTDDTDVIHREERIYGKMQRSLALPPDVLEEEITAEVGKGVLHILIPKQDASKPYHNVKRIEIGGK